MLLRVYHVSITGRAPMRAIRRLSQRSSFLGTRIEATSNSPGHRLGRFHAKSEPCLFHLLQFRELSIQRKKVAKPGGNNVVKNNNIMGYLRGMDTNEVRLIGTNDIDGGIMHLKDALSIGKTHRLDVVLIAPQNKPPTCKLIDLGLENFKQKKKQAEQRKLNPKVQTKGVRLKASIAEGDFDRKVKDGMRFISKGMHVQVTVVLPRVYRNQDQVKAKKKNIAEAASILKKYAGRLSDVAEVMTSKGQGGKKNNSNERIILLKPLIKKPQDH